MQRNVIETATGAIVLAVAAVFALYASQHSQVGLDSSDGYPLHASFTNATGISTGSDVRIGGVKVGVVSDIMLDKNTYEAVATFLLKRDIQVPSDSSAAVASAGLLGDKFVDITPGGSEEMLQKDGKITYTQSSVSLEQLIGKFMFGGGSGGSAEKGAAPAEKTAKQPAPDMMPDLQ